MKEICRERDNSVYVLENIPQDFNDIFFAANHKNITIKMVQEKDTLAELEHAKLINNGDMVLKISFNDNNGTRQAFLGELLDPEDNKK